MHSALWQLLWFDLRGSLRGLLNYHRNWRQLVLFALMLLFVGLLLTARMWDASAASHSRFGAAMPFWALIYLLATWFTASADRGLVMRPAEIHFVVGGPFSHRDVITMNLVRLASRALISALVLSLIALAYVPSYPSAVLGMWLMMAVSLLVGMIASLMARRVHSRRLGLVRRLLSALAVGTLLLLVMQSMRQLQAAGQTPQVSAVASVAGETPLGRAILPPLAWMFAPLSAASFWSQAVPMLPVRLGVVACLVGLIYLLGGQYAEASTGRTDASIARRHAALRSGIAGGSLSGGWTRRLSLPGPYHWGGIGSVAWMQMVHSLRILPRYLVFTSAIVGLVLVVPLLINTQHLHGTAVAGWMAGLTSYADFLLLLQLPVGFLGPVAQREKLKSLPIAPWKIAIGQLAGAAIPLSILHLLIGGLFLVLVPDSAGVIGWTFVALIPAALVLVANINLLGAWNIIRPRALQQRDALAAGRAMASVWIFMGMLTPAAVVSGLVIFALHASWGPSFTNTLLGAALGLLLSSSLYIGLLARSFARWQPSASEGGLEETEYDQ